MANKYKERETVYNENCFAKKGWKPGAVQIHMEPPPILIIKSKNDAKSDKDSVKIKLLRDLTSNVLDIYEFKMALFDNGDP